MSWSEQRPSTPRRRPEKKSNYHPQSALLGGTALLVALSLLGSLAWMVSSPGGQGSAQQTSSVVFDPSLVQMIPAQVPEASLRPNGEAQQQRPADSGRCQNLCLIRMSAANDMVNQLSEMGIPVAYEHENFLWTGVLSADLDRVESELGGVELLANAAETTFLYVIRVPEGVGDGTVREYGDILDQAGNQYLVEIPGPPALAEDLVDDGISIEKLPPLTAPSPQSFASEESVSDPWQVASAISRSQLKQRILDLQAIGAVDGDEFGTRQVATAGNVEAAEYLYRRLASYGLSVHYEDFVNDQGRLLLNVVGEIPGKDDSEVYLLTAHFDTISTDIDDARQSPGALDNATGMAVLLEVARVLAPYELEHPVMIVFFNSEEYGLQGAKAFGKRSEKNGREFAGGFNVDAVGADLGRNQLYVNTNAPSKYLQTLLIEQNDAYGLGITMLPRQTPKIRADEGALNDYGIPIVMVGSVLFGDDLINQSNDTIANVNMEYETVVAQLIAVATAELVM